MKNIAAFSLVYEWRHDGDKKELAIRSWSRVHPERLVIERDKADKICRVGIWDEQANGAVIHSDGRCVRWLTEDELQCVHIAEWGESDPEPIFAVA